MHIVTGKKYCVTQLQLLDPEAGSGSQIWHVDNLKGGITFIIPLVDVHEQNAPTLLIRRSHLLFSNGFAHWFYNSFGWSQLASGEVATKPVVTSAEVKYIAILNSTLLLHYSDDFFCTRSG